MVVEGSLMGESLRGERPQVSPRNWRREDQKRGKDWLRGWAMVEERLMGRAKLQGELGRG